MPKVEKVVSAAGDDQRCRESAQDAERRDGDDGPPEAPPPDVHAAVEEDDDQGDDPDSLDRANVLESDRQGERRNEEERRGRDRVAGGELVHEQGEQNARRDDQHDRAEIDQLVHGADANGFLTSPSFRAQSEPPYLGYRCGSSSSPA